MPVFCSEELSCLPYKNHNKSLTLSFREGKFKFAVLWGLFIKSFFHWATFTDNKEDTDNKENSDDTEKYSNPVC